MKNIFVLSTALMAILVTSASSATETRQQSCKKTSEQEISALFDRWNRSLQTGNPGQVVANYASRSVLLPTLSNKPRLSSVDKQEYFTHFLKKKPVGKIDSRTIHIGCNTATDVGLYTFTFAATGEQVEARYTYTYNWNGQQWLIASHHSSAMPEKK